MPPSQTSFGAMLLLAAPIVSAFHVPPHVGLARSSLMLDNSPRIMQLGGHRISIPMSPVLSSFTIAAIGSGGSGGKYGGGGTRRWGSGDSGGGGQEGSPGFSPVQIWAAYLNALDVNPLKTRMATGFLISFLGDILSQNIEKVKDLDLKRLFVFSCWGGFGFTPIGYKWYNFIEQVIPKDIPARFMAKMVVDQAVLPPFMIALTFVTLTIVEGLVAGYGFTLSNGPFRTGTKVKDVKTLIKDGFDKVRMTFVTTLIENYKVWPAAQILTFGVVPLRLQLLFVNCVAVWWNTVLSLTQHFYAGFDPPFAAEAAQVVKAL